MPLIGAHMSIAGGFYKAVERAAAVGCETLQIFTAAPQKWPVASPLGYRKNLTKNNNQWRAKEITPAEAAQFRQALAELNVAHPLSHSSYLINLASADVELWKKSIDAFVVELQRAEMLGIPYVVLHPGAFVSGTEQAGIARVAAALDEVHGQCRGLAARCLLENTAGQGSCLGWRFEQLAEILSQVKDPDRLGLCVDTCHLFAAGYPLAPQSAYRATFRELDQLLGLGLIRAFHLNDSVKPQGSRVDRHAHIGRGQLGLEPFRLLLNDRRFRRIPMYLETPKGLKDGRELDAINLHTLRSLVK